MFEANILPMDLRSIVDNEIGREERLLWTGQPKSSRLWLLSLPIVLFAIPWTAFSIFWMWGASGFGRDGSGGAISLIFLLFGLPFVLIGLGMFTIPFWIKRRAKNTVYAVTDKRAIIIVKGFSVSVNSFDSRSLNNLTKRVRPDGSGDLIFMQDSYYNSDGHRRTRRVGFWGVPDVNKVEDLIEDIRQEN